MRSETRIMKTEKEMVRHARSESDRKGVFTGWADPALALAGHREPLMADEALAAARLTLLMHSARP